MSRSTAASTGRGRGTARANPAASLVGDMDAFLERSRECPGRAIRIPGSSPQTSTVREPLAPCPEVLRGRGRPFEPLASSGARAGVPACRKDFSRPTVAGQRRLSTGFSRPGAYRVVRTDEPYLISTCPVVGPPPLRGAGSGSPSGQDPVAPRDRGPRRSSRATPPPGRFPLHVRCRGPARPGWPR